MKRLLIILVLLIPVSGFGQTQTVGVDTLRFPDRSTLMSFQSWIHYYNENPDNPVFHGYEIAKKSARKTNGYFRIDTTMYLFGDSIKIQRTFDKKWFIKFFLGLDSLQKTQLEKFRRKGIIK